MTELEQRMYDVGLFPVATVKNPDHAEGLAHALVKGGLPAAEITFRVAGAGEVIRRMLEAEPDMLVGAGTVLTRAQADEAIAAGAKFIVTPGLDPDIVSYCQEKGVTIMPGCATPSDLAIAHRMGIDTVKFFPAEPLGGLPVINAISAPYNMMRFVPTGGISADTIGAYLANPKVLACGGSFIVKSADLDAGNFEAIEQTTRAAVRAVFDFKLYHVGLNAGDPETAARGVALLSEMFNQPFTEHTGAYMYGSWFEIMKKQGRGKNGHIGIETNSIERAVAYFRRKGYAFIDESFGYDEKGRLCVAYFRDEIFGFAFHLSARF